MKECRGVTVVMVFQTNRDAKGKIWSSRSSQNLHHHVSGRGGQREEVALGWIRDLGWVGWGFNSHSWCPSPLQIRLCLVVPEWRGGAFAFLLQGECGAWVRRCGRWHTWLLCTSMTTTLLAFHLILPSFTIWFTWICHPTNSEVYQQN